MVRNQGVIKRLSTIETSPQVYKQLIAEGHEPKFDEVDEHGAPTYMDSDDYTVINGCIYDISGAPNSYDSEGELNEATKISDTEYRIHAYYYNGGADLSEMLDESLPRADKAYENKKRNTTLNNIDMRQVGTLYGCPIYVDVAHIPNIKEDKELLSLRDRQKIEVEEALKKAFGMDKVGHDESF